MISPQSTPPVVSVLMPTFNQAAFIHRAIASLRAQTLTDWELIIVNDGSPDDTNDQIQPYLEDTRIRLYASEENIGLGAALNYAFRQARSKIVAYLPSDDIYYPNHLSLLLEALKSNPDAVLAYAGVKNEFRAPGTIIKRSSLSNIEGYALQLVQVMHRITPDRWTERDELVTDDLGQMFWSKLQQRGPFVGTQQLSCEWVDHPQQRHKLIQEPSGGINRYRFYYNVKQPLRFHTTAGNKIDEISLYRRFRDNPDIAPRSNGLKILLVGELAYNPERIVALAERGHKLYGLWSSNPEWFHSIGPVPFGHVEDLSRTHWREQVRKIKPDVIYGLLNWGAVPLAHQVLMENTGIPFVWHLKEGPFHCLANGTWKQLVDLYTRSDGQIYLNQYVQDWFKYTIPQSQGVSLVLDGDLPKNDWFTNERSPRLSERDGQIHTVVPGGPIGIQPAMMEQLAQNGVHLHFYGDFFIGRWKSWIEAIQRVAPNHLHLHSFVNSDQWVAEFSQYDAGWLHIFKSENQGDLIRASWDDLNYPARIAVLAAAGIPAIQFDNEGSIVATQSLLQSHNMGLFYKDLDQLNHSLHDSNYMTELRNSVWSHRTRFSWDYHVDRLINFFHEVIKHHQS